MSSKRADDINRLVGDIEWAIQRGLGARDLVPMLEKLAARAPESSPAAAFARLELGELIVAKAPWRAALLARRCLAAGNADADRAWGVLGLAHTILGDYRAAAAAYRRALMVNPNAVACAHNLGHLLDAVFNCPERALTYLARAHRAWPGEGEIAASYAHALVRVQKHEQARKILERALPDEPDRARELLNEWSASRLEPMPADDDWDDEDTDREALAPF